MVCWGDPLASTMYRAGVGATGSDDELSPLRPLSATLKRVPARRCVRPAPSSAFPQSKAVATCWPKPTVCPLELVAQPYSSPNIPRPHIVRREHRAFSNDEEEPCTSKSRPLHLATKAYALIRKGAAALSLIIEATDGALMGPRHLQHHAGNLRSKQGLSDEARSLERERALVSQRSI